MDWYAFAKELFLAELGLNAVNHLLLLQVIHLVCLLMFCIPHHDALGGLRFELVPLFWLIDHVVGNAAKRAKLVQTDLIAGEGLYRGCRGVGAMWHAILDEHRCIHRFGPPMLDETGVGEHGHGISMMERRLVNTSHSSNARLKALEEYSDRPGSEDLDLPSCLRLGPHHDFRELGLLVAASVDLTKRTAFTSNPASTAFGVRHPAFPYVYHGHESDALGGDGSRE
ncbi:hypothetical protein AaE_003868 [Aphanomyces astaci]|uniref:Uncharacterized protein n=1 Tax=Aphanomyces astaci TaxID=112090 RepID=A0A6A5AU14_APHAT|nr:hypothetical protein AaE_003868 [Aphanomyces astaci]